MNNLENYIREDLAIRTGKAQLGAVIYGIPFILFFGIPYILLWTSNPLIKTFLDFAPGKSIWIIVIIFFGIILHELIHGITWSRYATGGFKSIKFGIMWKYLSPYCHCKEQLLVKQYIIGGIMPAVILGFIPSIFSIITGSFGLFLFGLFITIAAGGDFMLINLLRKESLDNLVQDHPSKVGCIIYRPKNIKKMATNT